MTIFLMKSLLSLLFLIISGICMYTMFEVFGRSATAIDRFKKLHKNSGYLYIVLLAIISYLCIGFMTASKTEPSPRAALHIAIALGIVALLLIKVLFVRVYRQFYIQSKLLGLVIGVMSFVLVGISAGYYLVVSGFGKDRTMDKSIYYSLHGPFLSIMRTGGPEMTLMRTDRQSIAQGRILFLSRCASCHDPFSTQTIIGPGLKGLLKNPALPVSKHPATAESLKYQLRQPMGRMPSFAYLSDDEMSDLIAYLNTL